MCGIASIYSSVGFDRNQFERMADALAHRGPDSSGQWISRSGRCGLASQRLSLNDLTDGCQPLTAPGFGLVVNGEFYDFERIRAELAGRGHTFKTRSDSEILLPLYREEGLDCLESLRGEFAFVLWDEESNRLVAARDRFGIKPLFYAMHGERLLLASEIKALLAAGVAARWNMAAYADHVMMSHGPKSTLFAGVEQLPPGHVLVADETGIKIIQYWDIQFPDRSEKDSRRREEVAEGLRAELAEAVRLRLRADVPIGAFLSAGLDSTAIVGLALEQSRPLPAFSVQFDDPAYDESGEAGQTAATLGLRHAVTTITSSDMATAWEAAVWHGETICDNGRGIGRLLQARAVREAGLKAVLSGEGADELLGGYYFVRQDLARAAPGLGSGAQSSDTDATAHLFRSMNSQGGGAALDAFDTAVGSTPSWATGLLSQRGTVIGGLLAPHFRPMCAPQVVIGRVLGEVAGHEALRSIHPVHTSLYLWIKTMLLNMVLAADRLEMAASLESRIPFLDHRFAELAVDVPVDQLFEDGLEKYPLRLAVRDVVPPAVFGRAKRPFTAPHVLAREGDPMRELLGDILHGPDLAACPFFEGGTVLDAFNAHRSAPKDVFLPTEQALMLIGHTCLMQRVFSMGE